MEVKRPTLVDREGSVLYLVEKYDGRRGMQGGRENIYVTISEKY